MFLGLGQKTCSKVARPSFCFDKSFGKAKYTSHTKERFGGQPEDPFGSVVSDFAKSTQVWTSNTQKTHKMQRRRGEKDSHMCARQLPDHTFTFSSQFPGVCVLLPPPHLPCQTHFGSLPSFSFCVGALKTVKSIPTIVLQQSVFVVRTLQVVCGRP